MPRWDGKPIVKEEQEITLKKKARRRMIKKIFVPCSGRG